jgi:hypothetical protein
MIDSTLLQPILFACMAVGAVFGIIAGFYVRPEKKNFFTIFYWRPKTDFTDRGWKLRQISLFFINAAVAIYFVSLVLKR